jgi:hypothetical protein
MEIEILLMLVAWNFGSEAINVTLPPRRCLNWLHILSSSHFRHHETRMVVLLIVM